MKKKRKTRQIKHQLMAPLNLAHLTSIGPSKGIIIKNRKVYCSCGTMCGLIHNEGSSTSDWPEPPSCGHDPADARKKSICPAALFLEQIKSNNFTARTTQLTIRKRPTSYNVASHNRFAAVK